MVMDATLTPLFTTFYLHQQVFGVYYPIPLYKTIIVGYSGMYSGMYLGYPSMINGEHAVGLYYTFSDLMENPESVLYPPNTKRNHAP